MDNIHPTMYTDAVNKRGVAVLTSVKVGFKPELFKRDKKTSAF